MNEIKRFDLGYEADDEVMSVIECSDGDFVKYSEYEATKLDINQKDELIAELVLALNKLNDGVVAQNRLGAKWHDEVFTKIMDGLSLADSALTKVNAVKD